MAQFESTVGASRAGSRDSAAIRVRFRKEAWQRWKFMAGALILLAILIVLIALSLSTTDLAESVVPMG
jgi:hypothetical protein